MTASSCVVCESDAVALKQRTRPPLPSGEPLNVVDLFSGCGGLSLGLDDLARSLGRPLDVRLAVDLDPDAGAVYRANFPDARFEEKAAEEIFSGELGDASTASERSIGIELGHIDVLVGGPPCQGNSDLNNHTRRRDGRNRLYLLMPRAAEILQPDVVLIENVPGVKHATDGVVSSTRERLERLGYVVEDGIVELLRLGVPQRRRRHVLVAYQGRRPAVLKAIVDRCNEHPVRSVRWAIEDLVGVASDLEVDDPSAVSPENAKRIRWLLDNERYDLPNELRPSCHHGDHSYVSMYGRLRWDVAAQTITTGFGSMGQGRYVHPSEPRTLTPHEAARLQLLPDWFDWSAAKSRGGLAKLIGNAAPPVLATTVVGAVIDPASARDAERAERRVLRQLPLVPALQFG